MSENVKTIADYEKEIAEIDQAYETLSFRASSLKHELEQNGMPKSLTRNSVYFKLAVELGYISELGLTTEDLMDLVFRDLARKGFTSRYYASYLSAPKTKN